MAIKAQLLHLGLISEKNLEIEFESSKLTMMKDSKTGVIFLDGDPIFDYQHTESLSYWGTADLENARSTTKIDDNRRFNQFSSFIKGRKVLDFGCGNGGFLNLCRPWADVCHGVDLQNDAREALAKDGLIVKQSLNQIEQRYETVTMFHVLEHIPDHIGILKEIKSKLIPGGHVIIEVPHARDILLELLDLSGFREKSYRGEHVILHTKESLRAFLEHVGFKNVSVDGCQRHSINNHLYYAKHNKPSATMQTWDFILSPGLRLEYAKSMERLGMTDTLIAVAEA